MIKKYTYGVPVKTDATVREVPREAGEIAPFTLTEEEGKFIFSYPLGAEDCVYGLGEQVRGINKRGWIYKSWNYDDPIIHEGRKSLYGAHNFIVVFGEKTFGAFFDCAGEVVFDIGYSDRDMLTVTSEDADVYILEGESVVAIVEEFRALIGPSYIPPKWAFGFAQSKWGYKCEADIRAVYDGYRKAELPLDMIYMDIDYMKDYKDFTVDPERYPDLPKLAKSMKRGGVHLVPIIDAAVKVEEGYPVYDEGVEKGYFCTDAEGKPYVVGVWPGDSVLPDVLNPEARRWFGSQYKALLDQGIEGFWNDMNEPGIFYSKGRLSEAISYVAAAQGKNLDLDAFYDVTGKFHELANNPDDYASFYHNAPDGRHGGVFRGIRARPQVPALLAFLLHRAPPLRRHLDGGQLLVVVALETQPHDDARARHVRLPLCGRRPRRARPRYDGGAHAPLARLRHLHATHAQPCLARHAGPGVLRL